MSSWWQRNFLLVEAVACLILTAVFVIWAGSPSGTKLLTTTLQGNRPVIYSALTALWGSLLGFIITAVSIILGLWSNERLAIIRKSGQDRTLWHTFTQTTWILAVATLASVGALVMDAEKRPTPVMQDACVLFSLLAIARVARCVWILQQLLKIVTPPPPKSQVAKKRRVPTE